MNQNNIKEYIDSGIIESYVLGVLSPEERTEVERLARQCNEIQMEIEANTRALTTYILQYQEYPPLGLRERVWQKLETLHSHNVEAEAQMPRPTTDDNRFALTDMEMPLLREPRSRESVVRRILKPYAYMVGILLLLVSVGLDIIFYNDWQEAEVRLYALSEQNDRLHKQLRDLQNTYQSLNNQLVALTSPRNKIVELKGLEESPNAWVTLYWNEATKEVFVLIRNLPVPPAGKQYQLWSIHGDKVEDAGCLIWQNTNSTLLKMKTVHQANAFAITLERMGGVPKAEGKMYVKGGITAL